MIIKLILSVPLITVIFYTLVGIMKREVWIAGPKPGSLGRATKEKGLRALLFGISFSIIYIFFLFYFASEMQLVLDYKDWISAIGLALVCTWAVIFSERKLPQINPFKIVIPTILIIIVISWLTMFYFTLKP